jgi:hypothetical protein
MPNMNPKEILESICEQHGCVWATRNKGALKNKPIGFLFCWLRQNPETVLSESGCTRTAIRGQYDHIQGGDIRHGVMKQDGFTK